MLSDSRLSRIYGVKYCIIEKIMSQYKDTLYRNSYYIMINGLNSAITGFIFWIIVARLFDVQSVGLATVIISASASVVNISGLGIGTSIIRFLHNEEDKLSLINTSLTIVCGSSIVTSIIFITGVSIWASKLEFILYSPFYVIAFIFFTAISAIFGIFLNVYIAQRDAKYFFFQSAISDIIRLFFPIIFIKSLTTFGIFGSLGASNAIALVISIFYFSKKVIPHYKLYPEIKLRLIKKTGNFSLSNYFVNLIANAPILALPFLILHFLTPEDNAYFYVAFSIANLLFIIPASLSTSLFAEGAFKENAFISNFKKAIKQAYAFILLAIVATIILGGKILLLFGPAYSTKSYLLLSILAISSIFLTLNSFYITYLKIALKTVELVLLNIALSVVTISLSYFLIQNPNLSINGIGLSYLLAQGFISFYVIIKLISYKSKKAFEYAQYHVDID